MKRNFFLLCYESELSTQKSFTARDSPCDTINNIFLYRHNQIVEQWDCDIEEDGRLKLSFNNGHSKHSIYVSFCPFCGGEKDTKEVL